MGTCDENGNYHFSDLNRYDLLRDIHTGVINMSCEEDSKTRLDLLDKVYADIKELYMRLSLYEIVYGTNVMDAWKVAISKKDLA